MTLPLPILPALMAPSPGGQGNISVFFLQLALIIGIFYFLLIRPQQKQKKQHEQALASLKKGDEVVTGGGVVGEVVHIKESLQDDGATRVTMEDRVTIKSGDTRLIVERGRISKITSAQGVTQG
jgi:preprotein translocase subunit YajC